MGYSLSSAGDVNNDGFTDVIIGAHNYNNWQFNEGRGFLFHGSANGLSTTPDWTAESNLDDALFGLSVSGAGDINGDGYDDVIVGAPLFNFIQSGEGKVYLFYGSQFSLSNWPVWTF